MLRSFVFPASFVLAAGIASAWSGAAAPAAARPAAPSARQCPYNVASLEIGATLACHCSSVDASVGSVWGSGPYTADSVLCRAAVHAGVIRGTGGNVTVRVLAGQDRYRPSRRNGVFSGTWSAYPKSIAFTR